MEESFQNSFAKESQFTRASFTLFRGTYCWRIQWHIQYKCEYFLIVNVSKFLYLHIKAI